MFIGLIKVQNRAAAQVLTIPPPCLLSLHILLSVGLLFPLFLPQDTVNALSDFLGFFHFLKERANFEQITEMLDRVFEKFPDDTRLIFHSDQGWQYQNVHYQKQLSDKRTQQSMNTNIKKTLENPRFAVTRK